MKVAARSLASMILAIVVAVLSSTSSAWADDPLPPPARADEKGVTDCGFIRPQMVFGGFAGPQAGFIPGPPAIDGKGKNVLRGKTVEGEAAVDVVNGGCGLSVTVTMQTKVCKKSLLGTSCGWKDWGSQKYTYDEVPTNGQRVFPPIRSALRPGLNSYRMVVEYTGNNVQTVDAVPGGRFRGAILPGRTSGTASTSGVVKLAG